MNYSSEKLIFYFDQKRKFLPKFVLYLQPERRKNWMGVKMNAYFFL